MGNFISRFGACAFAFTFVGLTALACGEDDSSAGSGPPADATMLAISQNVCAKYTECTSDLVIQIAYGNADGCAARIKAQFSLDLQSNGYGVTDASATSCLNAIKVAACADIIDNKLPDACHFKGALANGTNCTTDAQCQSGSCFVGRSSTCGKCGDRAALGADCTNAQCDFGLKCNATNICTNGALGSACGKDDDCHAFTYCRNAACTAPLEEGTACVTNGGDKEPPCNLLKGLICLPKTLLDPNGTCTKVPVSFAANGEKCGFTSISPPAVTACTNAECTSEKCVARLADGAACTGLDGQPKCQAPAECRNNVCSLKDPAVCK